MLRRVGAAAGGVALAGCLSEGSDDGADGTGDGAPDESSEQIPTATLPNWLPAPSVLDTDGYRFSSLAPRRIATRSEQLGDGATNLLEESLPVPEVGSLANADAAHQLFGRVVVLEASFDRDAVESQLSNRVPGSGSHRGFSIFGTDAPPAFAVGDEAILLARAAGSGDDADKRPLLSTVIDARTGNADRYPDTNGDCATLLSALGPGHVIYGRTHEPGRSFEGALAEGGATLLSPDQTRVRFATVFESGTANPDAVGAWVSGSPSFHGASPSVRQNGRTILAAATLPTGEVTGFPQPYPDQQ